MIINIPIPNKHYVIVHGIMKNRHESVFLTIYLIIGHKHEFGS